MKIKFLYAQVIFLISILIFTTCDDLKEDFNIKSYKNPIKIAVVGDVTIGREFAENVFFAVKMAADEINSNGGLTINGVEREIELGDTILESAGKKDIFIVKSSSSGIFTNALSIGGKKNDEVQTVVSDTSGNIYVSGQFKNSLNLNSTIVNIINFFLRFTGFVVNSYWGLRITYKYIYILPVFNPFWGLCGTCNLVLNQFRDVTVTFRTSNG